MIDPAAALTTRTKPATRGGAKASAEKEDLGHLLDRARQERFRLLQLLGDAREKVQDTAGATRESVAPVAVPAADTAALDEKLAAARDTERRLDAKLAKLATAELRMANLVERLATIAGEARELEPALQVAAEHAESLQQIHDRLHQHGSDTAKLIDERLARQTADFERRLDDHAEVLCARQVDEQQAFADAVSRQKQGHLDQLSRELNERRATLLAQWDASADEARRRMEDRVEQVLGELDLKADERFRAVRERLESEAAGLSTEAEAKGRAALESLRHRAVEAMGRADEVHRTVKHRLDAALDQFAKRTADACDQLDADLLVKAQKLDERLAGLADLFDHQVDTLLADVKDRANRMLDRMAESMDAGPRLPQQRAA